MIELILGTYGVGCWLIFKKFKLVKMTTYTVCTAVLGGIVILFSLMVILSVCHPVSHDGRFYATVTQVVPEIRGRVVEVQARVDVPLRAGDVLFRIDPKPYQLEVERMEAILAGMNSKAAQLEARLASATAATEVARSNLLVSESDYDRQARIALENAQAQISQIQSRLVLAKANLDRTQRLSKSGASTQMTLDADTAQVEGLDAELIKAQSAEKSAQETLASGSDRLKVVQDQLKQAEAVENEARIALEAESNGLNPEVRQAMVELERKRWELEQTAVRAPADGSPTYISLRPGQMVTPFSVTSSILFVPQQKRFLVATFPQNAIRGIEPGLEVEFAFKALPGQIFSGKVAHVMEMTPEGQFVGTGRIQSTTSANASGDIPVMFEYGEEVEALNLPAGSQASIAVYTHHFHALSIVRKMILRVKSWENYAFFMSNFDAVH